MYLLPCEIFLLLYPLVLVTLIVHRWRHQVDRVTLAMACTAASWLFCNILVILDPPDNGLGNVAVLVMGWFWMLPLFWFLLCVDAVIANSLLPA